jgi:hypothetical protein
MISAAKADWRFNNDAFIVGADAELTQWLIPR